MSDNLVGYQPVTGNWRHHVAAVHQIGPSAYSVRTVCGGMGHTLVNSSRHFYDLDSAPIVEATTHFHACPRCLASYRRRVGGAA